MAAFHVRQVNSVTEDYISNGLWFAGSFVSTVAQKITRFRACEYSMSGASEHVPRNVHGFFLICNLQMRDSFAAPKALL